MQTGTPVNVAERMNRLTFNVVGRVLLGADPGALDAYSGTLRAIAMPLLHYIECACHPAVGAPALGPHTAQLAFSTRHGRLRCPGAADHRGTSSGQAAHREGQATDVLALLLAACDGHVRRRHERLAAPG